VSAGLSVVNRNTNQTYFGVTREEAVRSRFSYYEAGGGVQEARVGVRWNWALSPSWMLTSNLQVKGLLGNAAKSPLVERSTNMTVSTAFAYRF
jgi:outer membrane scaffolding protein for murein synthesis (MipA/OmpV family)